MCVCVCVDMVGVCACVVRIQDTGSKLGSDVCVKCKNNMSNGRTYGRLCVCVWLRRLRERSISVLVDEYELY